MISIYSFLQKRKLHENRHGILMVVTAYALSILMLVLGSDIFYNIDSAAAGIKQTGEETKDLSPTDTTDQDIDEQTAMLLQTQMISPYGLTETLKIEATQPAAETSPAKAETVWLLGSGMDNETFDSIMIHMGSMDTAKTDNSTVTADLAAVPDTKADKDAPAIKTSDSQTVKTDNKEEAAAEEKEADTYTVKVASSGKVITVTEKEVGMLERIVEAEAGGEDMIGKILIVNVIFNRMVCEEFPDTVKGVIFEHNDGDYQFSPVKSGKYWDVKVSKETKKAVQRALEGEDYSEGALYFVAKKRTKKSGWFDRELEWLFKHGGHDFYKG